MGRSTSRPLGYVEQCDRLVRQTQQTHVAVTKTAISRRQTLVVVSWLLDRIALLGSPRTHRHFHDADLSTDQTSDQTSSPHGQPIQTEPRVRDCGYNKIAQRSNAGRSSMCVVSQPKHTSRNVIIKRARRLPYSLLSFSQAAWLARTEQAVHNVFVLLGNKR